MSKGNVSPVAWAILAYCRYAAASQPAQGTRKNRPGFQKKREKKTKTGAQKWVPKTDPKMGPAFAPTIRILLKPESEAHFWVRFWDSKMGPEIEQKFENFLERILKKSARAPKKKDPRKNKAKAPGNQYPMGPRPGLFPQKPLPLSCKSACLLGS